MSWFKKEKKTPQPSPIQYLSEQNEPFLDHERDWLNKVFRDPIFKKLLVKVDHSQSFLGLGKAGGRDEAADVMQRLTGFHQYKNHLVLLMNQRPEEEQPELATFENDFSSKWEESEFGINNEG